MQNCPATICKVFKLPNQNCPENFLNEETLLPPWIFRQKDLTKTLENAQRIEQEALINKLNYMHFTGNPIFVCLRHPRYGERILVKAHPDPCNGPEVTCRWQDGDLSGLKLEDYGFHHLIIADGQSIILAPATMKNIDGKSLKIDLPFTGYVVGQRQARRHHCSGVSAELIQNSFLAGGELLDFNSLGFRIKVNHGLSCSFNWFNPDQQATVNLHRNNEILFSGDCRIIRHISDNMDKEIVLAPLNDQITRFKKKSVRNSRPRPVSYSTITFNHPFYERRVQREIHNISTSGFSVIENISEGALIPGLIIPDLTINYGSILKIRCIAQVVYRREEKESEVRCGLAILDMDIKDYNDLFNILTKANSPHISISSEVDMDALWEFFFDTGFIYPKKYHLVQTYRKDLRTIYREFYQENPEIAGHFTYEKNSRIYGYISMVRAYERTWSIQHHAAREVEGMRPGFMVLKQLINYLNGMYHLPSANMDYVMCYFRPENHFPDFIFGDFHREINNPKGCSMDLFSYMPYSMMHTDAALPSGWSLKESSILELWELDLFYKHSSGGLLFDAFGLGKKYPTGESLKSAYGRLGFTRNWTTCSLTHNGKLKAGLIANQSDPGVNLSGLLNSIKILVVDSEGLSWEILSTAINQLAGLYQVDRVPILIYPLDYVETMKIPHDRQYQLWIMNVHYGNEYLEYMQKKFGTSF